MAAKKKSSTPTAAKTGTLNTQMVESLITILSGTYVLAVRTQGYHWNVVGPQFVQLHELFGTHYDELIEAADELAERIRALGFTAPSSMEAFLTNSPLDEEQGEALTADDMLNALIYSHATLRDAISHAIDIADEHDDDVTEDMLIGRAHAHDKTLWMLHALTM